MSPKQYISLLALILWPGYVIKAQKLLADTTRISVEQGLSNPRVAISQTTVRSGKGFKRVANLGTIVDNNGFVWVATENGLNRYDGYETVVFNNSKPPPYYLRYNKIRAIWKTREGNILIFYQREVNAASNWSNYDPNAFGLLNTRTGRYSHLKFPHDSPEELVIYSVNKSYNGHILAAGRVGTQLMVFQLNDAGSFTLILQKELVSLLPTGTELPSTGFRAYWDPQGRLWVGFSPRFYIFNAAGDLLITRKVGLHGFAYLLKPWPQEDTLVHYFFTSVFPQKDSSDRGIDYQPTSDGFLKIVARNNRIGHYLAPALPPGVPTGVSIRGMNADKRGNVYLATEEDGLYYLDKAQDSTYRIQLDALPVSGPLLKEDPKNEYYYRNILPDHDGGIWISNRLGIGRFFPDLQKLDFYPSENRSREFCQASLLGSDGKFWFVNDHLNYLDTLTGQRIKYLDRDGANPLRNERGAYMLETSDTLLWIGTHQGGLIKVDRKKGTSVQYYNKSENPDYYLPNNSIHIIHEDDDQTLWLGAANGLIHFDPAAGRHMRYTKEDGLPDNQIAGLLPDGPDHFWISTYNGLSYFNKRNKTFRNFFSQDGLTHNEFNRFAFFQDRSGRFYFGGMNGVNAFFTEDLIREENPQLLLAEYSFYQKDSLITRHLDLQQLQQIIIPAQNRFLNLKFMLTDLRRPESNTYSYKLEGYDEDWRYNGTDREIRFNYLPAGHFTLRVRGAVNNASWSTHQFSVDLIVKDYFYRQGWFISLMGISLLAVILLIRRFELRQAVKLERLRTRIASDLHDNVGSQLTLIGMYSDLLKARDGKVDKQFIEKIAQTSSAASSTMRDAIWTVDARNDQMEQLSNRMIDYLAEMFDPKDIRYHFHLHNMDTKSRIDLQIRKELFLSFKEAINNVCKHSDADEVTVRLENRDDRFEMLIRDNGRGREQGNGMSGQGLANMEMRAKRIGGTVEFIWEEGFVVKLQMKSFC